MALNEYGKILKIGLRRPEVAFASQDRIAKSWQALGYHNPPDYKAALSEYDAFVATFEALGCEIVFLGGDAELGLDSIYVRDATMVSPKGLIACNMGKPARAGEPDFNLSAYTKAGLAKAGAITGQGRIEGGDFVWFDEKSCAVGQGYRSNADGIAQLKALFGPQVQVEVVGLPHYKGPSDVFHLMSFLSPLDKDLALVYSPLMPVPFRQSLLARGLELIEVPDAEFEAMACNVLALAPRKLLMVEGNPQTRKRLEQAGCEVITYTGTEISRKGEGGPTCLTRPLMRA